MLRIDQQPIRNFDEIRGAVQRSHGTVALEIEREGQRLVVDVTPRGGRIGVAPLLQVDRVSLLVAFGRGVSMPFAVVQASARELVRASSGSDKPRLAGPVAIVSETSQAGQKSGTSFLFLLAALSAYMWPFAASVPLFDAVTGYVFALAHREAGSSSLRGYRLERLRQACMFACAGYATFILAQALDAADVPFARLLLVGAMAAGVTGYPLLWLAGSQAWGRPSAALVLLASMFVPCLLLFAVLALHYRLGRALEREGFLVTWLSAELPASLSQPSRWGT